MKKPCKNSRAKNFNSALENLTQEEYRLVQKIVERMKRIGEKEVGYVLLLDTIQAAEMTIIYTHGLFNLMLQDFLAADQFNFIMEFRDIDINLNRQTGEMDNGFIPRFSIGQKK